MDPESKKLLEETLTLAQENNKILHSMRSSMRWARFMSTIYWLVIIGASIGAYYFVEPYLNKILDLYNSILNTQQQLNGGSNEIQDLLNKFKK